MKLSMSEHFLPGFRVRVAAARKATHRREAVVFGDDNEVMAAVVGRRAIPIVVKDDGAPKRESTDVAHG